MQDGELIKGDLVRYGLNRTAENDAEAAARDDLTSSREGNLGKLAGKTLARRDREPLGDQSIAFLAANSEVSSARKKELSKKIMWKKAEN